MRPKSIIREILSKGTNTPSIPYSSKVIALEYGELLCCLPLKGLFQGLPSSACLMLLIVFMKQ